MPSLGARPRLMLAMALGLGLVLLGTGAVVGATLSRSGKTVSATKVVTDDGTYSVTSTSFVDMPQMSTTISVSAGAKAILLINFGAETRCRAGDANTNEPQYCFVRVLVDGTAVAPGAVVFDSMVDGQGDLYPDYAWETNSMQFASAVLNAGQHTVKLQWSVSPTASGLQFMLAKRTLTVLRSNI